MAEDLITVRQFNKLGITRVRNFLAKVRAEGKLSAEEASEILVDTEYLEKLSEDIQIDRAKEFTDKHSLVNYLTAIFTDAFLEANRKNVGLWTWLAMVYYVQLTKTSLKHEKTAEARWVLDPDQPLVSRRHFIAGNVYLYLDMRSVGSEILDMIFSGPVGQFNTITDQLTHVQESIQTPAVLQVVGWLYHDPKSPKRIKRGATNRKAGSLFELIRVATHLALTWDFYDLNKASELWNKLPTEFDRFKGNAIH